MDLAKSLGSLSARFAGRAEGAPAAQVQAVVGVLLPLLLDKGLVSACKEVQGVSVLTLVRVVKGSGDAIRPYLPELVAALVEAQSAIEPAQLQYLQVRCFWGFWGTEGVEGLGLTESDEQSNKPNHSSTPPRWT